LSSQIIYSEKSVSVDERRAVDIVYLGFSKAFITVSCKFLIEKLMRYGLNEQTVRWTENWLNGWAQSLVVSGTMSCWQKD